MDESLELLQYVYENADVGVESAKKLIHLVHEKDNKIKSLLEDELKGYENSIKKVKNYWKNIK